MSPSVPSIRIAWGEEPGAVAATTGVVIVTHSSTDVLPPLLASLDQHEPDSPVVIVDDASPEGPPDPAGHDLVALSENRGFAAACNRGLARLGDESDLVAFLNPDVRLQGPSLTELAEEFEARPRVGVATGPLQSPEGKRLPSAWGPTSVRRALAFAAGLEPQRLRAAAGAIVRTPVATSDTSTYLDDLRVEGHVIGGTMVARRTCLDDVGGFDEEFFLYWEDADLCHRARAAGWEIRVLPCTPFVHADQQSTPGLGPDGPRWEYFVEGAHRFGQKHLVPGQARQLEVALELGHRLGRLRGG